MSYFYTILGLLGSLLSWFLGLFEKPGKATPSDPGEEVRPDPWNIVDHYGCPNSKRIQKLNAKRTQYHFREG